MSAALTLTLTGDAEVVSWLTNAAAALSGPAMSAALVAAALPILNAAKANVGKRSGTLARSLHAGEPQVSAGGGSIQIGTDVIYARIQEYGGTITAHGGGWLVFQIDGQWVRVRSVTLPARPYLRAALDANRGAAAQEFAAVLRAQLGRAA